MKPAKIQIKDIQGNYCIIDSNDLIAAATHHIKSTFTDGLILASPASAASHLQTLIGHYDHEVFYALWLNTQHQIIHHGELFHGTIDSASVYPREVVKAGLACNAAAVIFAHNHPSGCTDPSTADTQITKRLQDALGLVDIRVLDHFVIGSKTTSMAERGLL